MHQSVQDLLSKATALPQDNTDHLPVQTATPAPPKIGISRRNLALPAVPDTKPPAISPEPECGQAVYATVKPLPKPRKVPAPPPLPVPKFMAEPKTETKPQDLDISDKELDSASCDWNQKAQLRQDSSDSQLYSTVKPLLHTRRKPDIDNLEENPKSSRQSPVFGYTEVPVSFKQILSNVLFKDVTRIVPSPTPKSYRESSDLLDEPDYYEIQK